MMTIESPDTPSARSGAYPPARTRRISGRKAWPAAVAAAFVAAQLVLVRPGIGLGWDETVYVSQVSGHAPAAYFSAPRARGVSLLVAPIASWSSSTPLLRVYLSLLSGLALYLALRSWRGLLPTRVVALGGALFASLWVTLFYGPEAMPNYWVATGGLAAVGCFLRAQADRTPRGPVWGLAASAALMAWMRPTDAVWVTLPLMAALVVVRRWRHKWLLVALVAGLVAGAAEWVIEAYVSYGGLGSRLSDASRIQGELRWNNAVDDQLRSLSGRTLCRPCTGGMPHPVVFAWWFAVPVLALAGLPAAVRARRASLTVLPLACAATAAVPYLLFIGYAAPRFLLPAYALLAIPVADTLVLLVTRARGVWRPLTVTVVVVGLAAHLAVQGAVLWRLVDRTTASRQGWARTADALHRHGVRPPCVLTGNNGEAPHIPIAFYAGCASAQTGGADTNTTASALARAARRTPVAVLTTHGSRPPAYARTWRLVNLDGQVYAYLSPVARDAEAAAPGAGRQSPTTLPQGARTGVR
ncbi:MULTISPECIES: hypothetical protein [unclassified Streptomyces]|uniref:hypothetical protein n=1 Tax=unclassified Streptomyces TaxID=2593676 RepID=UPI00370342C1